MIKKTVYTIIAFIILFISLSSPLNADSLCPSNMDPNSRECLNYLKDQAARIAQESSKAAKQLSDEQYKQLSLKEQIAYTNSQIEQAQKVIQLIEVEVSALNVEISLLEKDVNEIEEGIALSNQEIHVLGVNINRRVTESYKYSFIGPLELFLDVTNIDTLLRKTKYLLATRERDNQHIEEYNGIKSELEEKEGELLEQTEKLQEARDQVEVEQENLLVERRNLSNQKAEHSRLLAESERKEKQLLATLEANRSRQAAMDLEISAYIEANGDQMADYGWVTKGTWIGNMGGLPSACSTGSHLHFSIDPSPSSYIDRGLVDPWAGYLRKGPDYYWQSASGWKYYYVRGGSMRLPLSGTVILTQDYHSPTRKAIDMYSLNGYGSPVYAAMDGNLRKGVDRCGENYAVIDNPVLGLKTTYAHLIR